MEEKIAKNLCFWCDDKFSLGHRYRDRQLYIIIVQDDDEKETK